jgi:hypothetical protein
MDEPRQPEKLNMKFEREIRVLKCTQCGGKSYGHCTVGTKQVCATCFGEACDKIIASRS